MRIPQARDRGLIDRQSTRDRGFICRLSASHFRIILSDDWAPTQNERYNQSDETARAARTSHFAVAKATCAMPASLPTFNTPMMSLSAAASSQRIHTDF